MIIEVLCISNQKRLNHIGNIKGNYMSVHHIYVIACCTSFFLGENIIPLEEKECRRGSFELLISTIDKQNCLRKFQEKKARNLSTT